MKMNRRDFLKVFGAGAGALAFGQLPGWAQNALSSKSDETNWANELYFPITDFQFNPDSGLYEKERDTTLALVNIHRHTDQGIEHGMFAYDRQGNELARIGFLPHPSGVIRPGQFDAFSLRDLFANPDVDNNNVMNEEDLENIGFVKFASNQRFLGAKATRSLDDKMLDFSLAPEDLRSKIFIPHIAEQTGQWQTRIHAIGAKQDGNSTITYNDSDPLGLDGSVDNVDLTLANSSGSIDHELQPTGVEHKYAILEDTLNRMAAEFTFATKSKSVSSTVEGAETGLGFRGLHIPKEKDYWWHGHGFTNPNDNDLRLKVIQYDTDGNVVDDKLILHIGPHEKLVDVGENLGLIDACSHYDVKSLLPNQDDSGKAIRYLEDNENIENYKFSMISLFGTHSFTELAGVSPAKASAIKNLESGIVGNDEITKFRYILPMMGSLNKEDWDGLALVDLGATPHGLRNYPMVRAVGWGIGEVKAFELAANEKQIGVVADLFGLGPHDLGYLEIESDYPVGIFGLAGSHPDRLGGLNAVNNDHCTLDLDYRIDGIGEENDEVIFDIKARGNYGDSLIIQFDMGNGLWGEQIESSAESPHEINGIYRRQLSGNGDDLELRVRVSGVGGSFIYRLNPMDVKEEQDYVYDSSFNQKVYDNREAIAEIMSQNMRASNNVDYTEAQLVQIIENFYHPNTGFAVGTDLFDTAGANTLQFRGPTSAAQFLEGTERDVYKIRQIIESND